MLETHVEDQLPDYVLGLLAEPTRAQLEAHLRACEGCRHAAEALEEAVEAVALGLKAPVVGQSRLEAALAGGKRFEAFVTSVAALFDLTLEATRALLDRIDDQGSWEEGPGPGCLLMPVAAGPKCPGQVATLVKLDPQCRFPEHRHGDEEQVLVLEGGYLDSTGIEKWRGELDVRPKGSSHSFVALDGPPCICASVSTLPDIA